jgi:outer membrane autotransporter protein
MRELRRQTTRLRFLLKPCLLIFIFFASSLSYADDWTGTTSSDWFTSTNWSAGIPTSTTDVNINAAGFSPNLTAAGAVANNLFIGSTSPNTFTINTGGALHSANAYIGYASSGTAVVNGPNATWNNDGLLAISDLSNSSATLDITAGGIINTGSATIGSQALASGTAVLSGAGSAWNITNTLYVGENGVGTLVVGNAAAVTSGTSYIGYGSASTGFVSIDGVGTSWRNSGDLIVSNSSSSGELDISNGGLVTDVNGVIANNAGSSGIVSVTDAGTVWNNNNSLTIGNAGAGSLTLSTNAAVNVGGLGLVNIGANSTLNIGAAAGSSAAQSGAFTAATVQLNGNGMIVFNHTDSNYIFNSAIGGTGSVLQDGAGSTILNGANSYTGGTLVSAGTLQGTTSGLQGNIVNNSHVVFDQTSTGIFSGTLSGSGDLTKNNVGTVIFTNANTHLGNTTINAGVLQINAENNLGNGSTLIFGTDPNNPTATRALATTRSFSLQRDVVLNNDATFSPQGTSTVLTLNSISGSGSFLKSGTGVVLLANPVGYSGNTTVQQGILRAGTTNVLVASPTLQVASSGEFDENGFAQRVNNLINNGVVSVSSPAPANNTFNSLVVNGNLSGNGVIALATNLLTQTGDAVTVLGATSGQQQLIINNIIQNSDPAPTSVIKLVQTNGGGRFFGSTDAGTYLFSVAQGNGAALTPDPNAWYLIYTPELSATANAAIGLYSSGFYQLFADMRTLTQRLGELRLAHANGFWVKPYGNRMTINNQASRQFDQNTGGFDIGLDHLINAVHGGALYVGVFAGYLTSDLNFHQGSAGAAQGFSLGVYGTWLHAKGWYIDAAAKYFQLWNDFHANTSSGATSTANYSVPAVGGSLEVGKRFDLHFAKKSFFIEPQTQLLVGYIQGMNYAASNGLLVAGNNQFSTQIRVGARVGIHRDFSRHKIVEPYLQASVLQLLSGNNNIATNSSVFTTVLPSTAGQLGAGATLQISQRVYANGEYDYVFAKGFHEPVALSAGIRWVLG